MTCCAGRRRSTRSTSCSPDEGAARTRRGDASSRWRPLLARTCASRERDVIAARIWVVALDGRGGVRSKAPSDTPSGAACPEKHAVPACFGPSSIATGWQIDLMRIGLIDDSEVDRFLARRIIRHAVPIATVEDFASPTEVMRAAKQGVLPSVLLLDLEMPRMSGFDILNLLDPIGGLKIAVLTSSMSGEARKRSMSYASVVAFISKPLRPQDLFSFLIQEERRRQRDGAETVGARFR